MSVLIPREIPPNEDFDLLLRTAILSYLLDYDKPHIEKNNLLIGIRLAPIICGLENDFPTKAAMIEYMLSSTYPELSVEELKSFIMKESIIPHKNEYMHLVKLPIKITRTVVNNTEETKLDIFYECSSLLHEFQAQVFHNNIIQEYTEDISFSEYIEKNCEEFDWGPLIINIIKETKYNDAVTRSLFRMKSINVAGFEYDLEKVPEFTNIASVYPIKSTIFEHSPMLGSVLKYRDSINLNQVFHPHESYREFFYKFPIHKGFLLHENKKPIDLRPFVSDKRQIYLNRVDFKCSQMFCKMGNFTTTTFFNDLETLDLFSVDEILNCWMNTTNLYQQIVCIVSLFNRCGSQILVDTHLIPLHSLIELQPFLRNNNNISTRTNQSYPLNLLNYPLSRNRDVESRIKLFVKTIAKYTQTPTSISFLLSHFHIPQVYYRGAYNFFSSSSSSSSLTTPKEFFILFMIIAQGIRSTTLLEHLRETSKLIKFNTQYISDEFPFDSFDEFRIKETYKTDEHQEIIPLTIDRSLEQSCIKRDCLKEYQFSNPLLETLCNEYEQTILPHAVSAIYLSQRT